MISWKRDSVAQTAAICEESMECKAGDLLIEAARPSGEAEERSGGNESQAEAAGETD